MATWRQVLEGSYDPFTQRRPGHPIGPPLPPVTQAPAPAAPPLAPLPPIAEPIAQAVQPGPTRGEQAARLAQDIAYGRSDWERAGQAVLGSGQYEDASGLRRTGAVLGGVALGGLALASWIPGFNVFKPAQAARAARAFGQGAAEGARAGTGVVRGGWDAASDLERARRAQKAAEKAGSSSQVSPPQPLRENPTNVQEILDSYGRPFPSYEDLANANVDSLNVAQRWLTPDPIADSLTRQMNALRSEQAFGQLGPNFNLMQYQEYLVSGRVGNLSSELEALAHWNHVGNNNIQSLLRGASLEDVFLRQLAIDMESATQPLGLRLAVSNLIRQGYSEREALAIYDRLAKDAIQIIDSMMPAHSSHAGFVGYRGLNAESLAASFGDDFFRVLNVNPESLVGRSWKDSAFSATSLSPTISRGFINDPLNSGAIFRIDVPSGVGAVPVNGHINRFNPMHAKEYEMLLQRNLNYEIVGVTHPDDIYRVIHQKWADEIKTEFPTILSSPAFSSKPPLPSSIWDDSLGVYHDQYRQGLKNLHKDLVPIVHIKVTP